MGKRGGTAVSECMVSTAVRRRGARAHGWGSDGCGSGRGLSDHAGGVANVSILHTARVPRSTARTEATTRRA